jgi:glycosyltransferase involved in cell wall biosynthesis
MPAPYVSIGLPVFNGERFLARAIETIVEQDFENFELLISDNHSTDGTEEIVRQAMSRDRRIRYERHDRNRGASYNYNRLLDRSNPLSRYVKWAACDDEHDAKYLTRTIELLDADPTASLAHCATADIDEGGHLLRLRHQPIDQLGSERPADRLRQLVTLRHECFGAFGLIPREVACATRGLGPFADADNVLLVEIALRGRMVYTDDVLFFRRQHADRSMSAFTDDRDRIGWFDPDRLGTITYPKWRLGREFVAAIARAPLSSADRMACYRALSAFIELNWQNLTKNLVRSSVETVAQLASGRKFAAADRASAPS